MWKGLGGGQSSTNTERLLLVYVNFLNNLILKLEFFYQGCFLHFSKIFFTISIHTRLVKGM